MGSDSANSSQDDRDEDDDEEYEEEGGGNRLLGFMFGNVDGAGDLDVDYLDEDAKEHLAALADKLGSSLTEIDLSVKSNQASANAAEEDYDEKAEDAVDYEDIDEQYEGPEIQATTEEDYLLSKKEYFATKVSETALEQKASVFDDDNYDDDEEDYDKEHETVDTVAEVHNIPSPGKSSDSLLEISAEEIYPPVKPVDTLPGPSQEEISSRGMSVDTLPEISVQEIDPKVKPSDTLMILSEERIYPSYDLMPPLGSTESLADLQEKRLEVQQEPPANPLPVLYVEDGNVILRFSEIFGNYGPVKKGEKKERRYSVLKEKYMTMDMSSLVEEDDEEFLKGNCRGRYFCGHMHALEGDSVENVEKDLDSTKVVSSQAAHVMTSHVDDQRLQSYLSGEPMKEDIKLDMSAEWSSSLSPNRYHPLDQLNWEDQIIWDNSPTHSDNAAESFETSGPETEEDIFSLQQERKMKSNESDHSSFLRNYPVLLESFDSSELPDRAKGLSLESNHHPQLLRLESRLEHPNHLDSGKDDVVSEGTRRTSAIKRFNKLTPQNRDLVEGTWLDKIIWEPQQSVARPKLILDLQDEQMLFEVSDDKDGEHLRLHAGAMIIPHSVKSVDGDKLEPHGHGAPVGDVFNIANDKFYSSRKISQQLKLHSKKRAAHGVKVLHSVPALKLQTVKPKLSNKDIANFHRPKALWYPHDNEVALKEQGQLTTQGPMKIILKSLGGKGSKLHVDAEETVSSVKAKASKKLDYRALELVKIFYSGRELKDDESLAAQDVRPNSLLHLVRTNIYLWPRAQKIPGENKSLRPPGAFKKKSDLSVKDGHVFLMEYCEERPLLLGNVGMGARICTYYQKTAPDDQTGSLMKNKNNSLGSLFSLDPADKSPFLGDIRAGSSQTSLETNMYRAPIYPHKVSTTDYLLVRSSKGKLSIRRIDRLNVVGQQEPHMEVMSPGSKGVQAYIMDRLLVYMYREFRTIQKRGLLPCIRADELSAQFPAMSEAFLRKRLKHCADMQRGANGHLFWVMRRNFRIPLEEELRRMVTPENVCAYESMQAGQYRLKRLGITRLTSAVALSSAMNQLPDEAITLAAASHIERELQITPWNLSSNFVACTSQGRENLERLEISGVGDPSGRGLGFSFVRATPKAPVSNATVKKKVTVDRGGTTVTGTDADLRRLSMEAARELLLKFNVPEEQIAKLTRWHRIAMIRKLSSEQITSGLLVDPTTISKFARGQRMSFLQLQQQTREKCQEIWDRQVQSLAAVDGDEYESDTEVHSDLDSFAGDLENLLDAEEGEEGGGDNVFKHSKADGVKGLKMRRRPLLAQAEDEIEDEAAEAAELCRMLMDDDEAELKKKKKPKAAAEGVGRTIISPLKADAGNVERTKKGNVTPKKVAKTIQPDESLAPEEVNIREAKKEEMYLPKKSLSTKVKSVKMNDSESMGFLNKKVKILADGIQYVKEKKSAREKFVCGACGQLGHMRTNKNCPKYREDSEAQVDGSDPEKTIRSNALDPVVPTQKKIQTKKLVTKISANLDPVATPDDDRSSVKGKILKVKCGATDKFAPSTSQGTDKPTPSTSQGPEAMVMLDAEAGNQPTPKVNKIIFSKKATSEDVQGTDKLAPSTSQGPEAVVLSDAEAGNQPIPKVNKIIFSKKVKSEDEQIGTRKPSVVIKPPVEIEKEQPRRIIIKRAKEIINLEESSMDGGAGQGGRKMKRINEIPSFANRSLQEEAARKRNREEKRWLEEEEKRKIAEREEEERTMRLYEHEKRLLEEQERFAKIDEIKRYELAIKREREEEERQKAKKKKKKKRPEEDIFNDLRPRRNDRKQPERDWMSKREMYSGEYAPPTKRRKGGEVGLANILEGIVETLKDNHQVSFLFLKPVTKKEAPDYFDHIQRPMDLSTIKEKVRKLEYKSRDEFRHDVWQITFNAVRYNTGRNPGIPPLAEQLLEICDFLLEDNARGLDEAEAGIQSDT